MLQKDIFECQGIKRQTNLRNFVVDFFCLELQLVIEPDGSIHAENIVQFEDKEKEQSLIFYGLKMIRFTNDEVIKDVDAVVTAIKNAILKIKEKGPL